LVDQFLADGVIEFCFGLEGILFHEECLWFYVEVDVVEEIGDHGDEVVIFRFDEWFVVLFDLLLEIWFDVDFDGLLLLENFWEGEFWEGWLD
jgi:hypothetical protein